jgi:glycosyltransferase involved in cell wall biosynthesis
VTGTGVATLSVVIPVFNMGRFLPDAVASVEAQALPGVEIIVVDDGSTDDTPAVIAALGDRVIPRRQANRGPAAARNAGIELASAELLAFLDADDLWPAGKLAMQVGRLERDPQLDVVLGRIQYVAVDGGEVPDVEFEDVDAKTVMHVHLGSGVYRRRAFDRIGPFDESMQFSEDVDWFLRAREASLRITIVPEITLIYRLHATNMTRELDARDPGMLRVLKRSLDRRRDAEVDGDLVAWRALDERVPDSPTVSVVIPAFDAERYVREAIRSAVQQTHRVLEVIVVDDGSSDATAVLARRFGTPVRVVRQGHAGIGAARNAGIRLARGEYIALLDADDLWERDKLARQLEVFGADPTVDLVFGGVEPFVSPELGESTSTGRNAASPTGRLASALLVRADVVARVGPQREDLHVGEFIDWYARAVSAGCRVGFVDGLVTRRRLHATNHGRRHRADGGDFARVLKDALDRRRASEPRP